MAKGILRFLPKLNLVMQSKTTFGLISDPGDPHIKALGSALKHLGHETLLIPSTGGGKFSYRDGTWKFEGKTLDAVDVFFFRNMLTPIPPAKFEQGEYKLYKDWFTQFMHGREVFGVQLSWLYALLESGKIIVNPPTAAGIGVIKPHQLYLLERAGYLLPSTLITNNPDEAKAFIKEKGKVIYKPAMGGAYAELADEKALQKIEALRNHYVIFQEFVDGADIRVTATADEILAVAEVENPGVDFRTTPGYMENKAGVLPCEIPDEIARACLDGLKLLGLYYSGIDLKRTPEGKYIFLEFNVHPAFLWIEQRLKKPVTLGIARLLERLQKDLRSTEGSGPRSSDPSTSRVPGL